jgi:hypothetical protein
MAAAAWLSGVGERGTGNPAGAGVYVMLAWS